MEEKEIKDQSMEQQNDEEQKERIAVAPIEEKK